MSATGLGAVLVVVAAVAGGIGTALSPRRVRPWSAGSATALVGLAGGVLGLSALRQGLAPVTIGWLLPLIGTTVAADGLSALFVLLVAAVTVATGVYTVGYAQRTPMARTTAGMLPLFAGAMTLVPIAASVGTFLVLWELMAGASVVLVLAEHHHAEVRAAGLLYAVMTHLGFLAILAGLVAFATAAHGQGFAGLAAHGPSLSPGLRTLVFLLTALGFSSKAGLLPLHGWLPRAHPAAPSPVSALMSAAMVALGVYGLLRVDVTLLGPGPRWWALSLLLVGVASAVYGALQSSMATDLKRLFAYSTSENMGLVTVGVGLSMLLVGSGQPVVAALALTAALLHLLAHGAFKTLAFLSAGSVQVGTGVRDLDLLGGLVRPMPVTTLMTGLAALGAAGLPLGAGFVGEWLLLQALVHGLAGADVVVALVIPLTLGAVALTSGLSVAAMVKAVGVGMLARPRSHAARAAVEAPATMIAGMGLAATASIVAGLAPVLLAAPVGAGLGVLAPGLPVAARPLMGVTLRVPGLAGELSPTLLAAVMTVAVLVAGALGLLGTRRRPPARPVPAWAGGALEPGPRQQYTATSFAEPLQRVFDDVLSPQVDVDVTHYAESAYLVQRVRFSHSLPDAVEVRLYAPVVRAVVRGAELVRRAHTGRIHLYLAYGLAGLLVVLVVAR